MLWIQYTDQEWFFEDATAPWENDRRWEQNLEILSEFGIRGTPPLVEILPNLIYDRRSNIRRATEQAFGPRVYPEAA